MALTATLGALTIAGTEGPRIGSDSGWNRSQSDSITRALGSNKDTILQMARGSHVRTFELWLTRTRFLAFQAMQGSLVSFTDWDSVTYTVYVRSVVRLSQSRPFQYFTSIELVEQ